MSKNPVGESQKKIEEFRECIIWTESSILKKSQTLFLFNHIFLSIARFYEEIKQETSMTILLRQECIVIVNETNFICKFFKGLFNWMVAPLKICHKCSLI